MLQTWTQWGTKAGWKFMLLKLEWRETSSFFIPLTIINIINDYYFGHTQKTEGMKQDKDSIRKPWQSDKGTFRWVWVQHTEGKVHMRRKHPSLEWQLGQEWITSLHPSKQKGIKQHPTQHPNRQSAPLASHVNVPSW